MKWTPRNTLNLILASIAACAWIAAPALPLSDEHRTLVQTAALFALAGLITPGSPVGRMLDQIAPAPGSGGGSESGHADPLALVWAAGVTIFGALGAWLLSMVHR